jgi:hypothetical protein
MVSFIYKHIADLDGLVKLISTQGNPELGDVLGRTPIGQA